MLCYEKEFNGVNIQPTPLGKVEGKALGANPRLSTRAVKLRKGNELHVSQRDELVSKWPDTAGAKGTHLPGPRGEGTNASGWALVWSAVGRREGGAGGHR